jgi:filamentous hemagglutinin family protein
MEYWTSLLMRKLFMNIKQLCGWISPCYLLFQPPLAPAEVITDGTLGRPTSLSAPNYRINADLGQQYGGNLFHSFSQFNLTQAETATFAGPGTVTNIVARVTGKTPSTIDGTIRSEIPQANLFFINPMGILFGPHASLDVTGAVHVTTADYLKLGKNGRFDASQPGKSILTAAPPSAFGFLGSQPATIVVEGLASAKQTVSLVGGDISIKGAWQAANGQITLNSVAGRPGEVSITTPMTNSTEAVAGGNITLLSNAKISTDTNNAAKAGDIVIRAGNLTLQERATITSNTNGRGSGSAGTITIQANHITMQGTKNDSASEIRSYTENHGGASGKIEIVARDGLDMNGRSRINVSASDTTQRAGNIVITTPKLTLADDATIDGRSNFKGSGGGEIIIKVQTLTMTGKTVILGDTANQGQGGNIYIEADKVILLGSSVVASITQGEGQGGNITLKADSLFLFDEATITTDTTTKATAGKIDLHVNHLVVTDSAKITSDAKGDNAYVRLRQGQAKMAVQLGAKSNGDFTGGGQAGKVCINQSGQDCDSHSAVALTRTVTAPPQFRSCPEQGDKNSLITTKPQGVTRGVDDLF